MDELLESLLEAEVLNSETAGRLKEAFTVQINEAIEAAKEAATADVRAELTEQWVQERDMLVEAVDTKVTDFIGAELEELRSDIENFRDLEVEHADRLVEARAAMAAELQSDLVELVEKIDSFLEIRLTAELEELREDIHEVRKVEVGRRIIEAFQEEMMELFSVDDAGVTLAETKQRLADVEEALEEAETKRAVIERKVKMNEVLSPLSGRTRDVMESILKSVETDRLDEGYNTFIGRVVKETKEDSTKETPVLAEGAVVATGEKVITGAVITGDNQDRIIEEAVRPGTGLTAEQKAALQRAAGIR